LVTYPAAFDLPHALVEWVTMLIVTREGDRRCKLRPSQRAIIALVYLREHTTYAKLAAGFRISEGTAHAYVQSVIKLLASRDRPSYRPFAGRGPSTSWWTAPSPSATGSATTNGTTRARPDAMA
jgi:hypothetical protein